MTERLRYDSFRRTLSAKDKGDGHAVLVIPGFMASDISTAPIRRLLSHLGYDVHGWELGRNLAYLKDLEKLSQKIDQLYKSQQKPISLIGWSLGGVYARELAKERPEQIRQVIAMASPFGGIREDNNANWLYDFIHGSNGVDKVAPEWLADLPNPAPVPSTAFYSKQDGIVSWKVCMEKVEDKWHQNIELDTSHIGMGVSPEALTIIVDRLRYDKSNWKHYPKK